MDAIFSHLGSKASDVIVPPARGFDNGVLRLASGRVLVFTADPMSFIPSIGAGPSAWLSLHHLASDMATSGVLPRYAIVDYNLPVDFTDAHLRSYTLAIGSECEKLGITVVGGHTGRYPGCGLSIIGGAVLFAEADPSGFVTPAMASSGDRVIITKGPSR
jgi:hydrogenase expression/formation protein HypE